MVGIKDMKEMPSACTSTQEILGDIEVVNCYLYNVCKHRETIKTNYKPTDCPLVEIVTCKDCKHNAYETKIKGDESIKIFCRKNKTYRCIDGFCSDGKRREKDEE